MHGIRFQADGKGDTWHNQPKQLLDTRDRDGKEAGGAWHRSPNPKPLTRVLFQSRHQNRKNRAIDSFSPFMLQAVLISVLDAAMVPSRYGGPKVIGRC